MVLDLGPQARWVPDYYACESVRGVPGRPGASRTLRMADPRLALRLVLRLGGLRSSSNPCDWPPRSAAEPPAGAERVRRRRLGPPN